MKSCVGKNEKKRIAGIFAAAWPYFNSRPSDLFGLFSAFCSENQQEYIWDLLRIKSFLKNMPWVSRNHCLKTEEAARRRSIFARKTLCCCCCLQAGRGKLLNAALPALLLLLLQFEQATFYNEMAVHFLISFLSTFVIIT